MSPEMRQKRHCVFRQPANRCGPRHGDAVRRQPWRPFGFRGMQCTGWNGEGGYCLNSQAMVPVLSRPNSVRLPAEPPAAARPVRRQAAGRAAQRLAQAFGLGSTMHRARTPGRTQQLDTITIVLSCQVLQLAKTRFRFRDFWRSREGHVWRVERATPPFLVSPSRSASSAFNAIC
jgi:hypothetical protein